MSRPKSTRTCRFEDCDGKHLAKGFCSPHYQQFVGDCKKDPNITPETWDPNNRPRDRRHSNPGRPKSTRTCRVPGCDGKHLAKGFCLPHYDQFYRDRRKNPDLTPETWDPNNRPSRRS